MTKEDKNVWKFCFGCGKPFQKERLIKLERGEFYLCISCIDKLSALSKLIKKEERKVNRQMIKYLTKNTDMRNSYLKNLKTDDLVGIYKIIKTEIEKR